MIWQHHEHQDGSGFPDGLEGEDISEGARLLRIVDEFDLLTNQHEQQEASNRQLITALVEISKASGTKFDPCWVGMLNEAVKLHKQHFQH